MYNIKGQIHEYVHWAILLLFLVVTFQLLSCLPNYDNPVSFHYPGDYQLNLIKPLPKNLEVLKTYTISFQNKGNDRYWKTYIQSSSPKRSFYNAVFKPTNPDTIIITFSDTFSGTLKLIGERQNSSKDSLLICDSTVHVINPYSIGGKERAGKGDSVPLYICYNGHPILNSEGMDIIGVAWIEDNPDTKHSSYIITSKDKSNIPITAKLFTTTDTLILKHLTYFNNYTPSIKTFFIESELQFGSSANFRILSEGKESDSLTYVIVADTDTLLDTTILSTTDTLGFSTLAIRDTSYSMIKLYITNDSNLTCEDSILRPKVRVDIPSISIDTNSTPAINDSVHLFAIGKAHLFHWIYKDSLITTTDNFLTLPPYIDTTSDTVYIYGENVYNFSDTSFHIVGDTDSIILKPTSYEYEIISKSNLQYIKTNALTSLQFAIKHGTDTLPDNTLNYTWAFSDTAGSKMKINFTDSKSTGPACTIFLKDSIPFIRITVQASILNSDIIPKKFTKQIPVRSFSPCFKFNIKSIADSNKLSFTIGYTSNDTSGTGGQVGKIYFKQVSPLKNTTDSIDNGVPMNITFNTSGIIKVEGWAIDTEGNVSKKDTLTFNIIITKPQFAETIKSVPATKGRQFSLDAKLVSPLDNLLYFWDIDNDGVWDTTTTTNHKDNIIFNKEGTDTIRVKCKNMVGDSAIMTFYVAVSKNAPIINRFSVNDSTQYIKDTLKFTAEITDPDSGLTGIYLHRVVGSIDTVVNSKLYTSPLYSINDTLTYTPNDSGHCLYILIANDQNGNSDSSIIPVVIDKGTPNVDSTKKVIVFAKYETKILIRAQDNDFAYLKYFISYDNNTSFSRVDSNALHTFDTPGWKIYFVKVMDIDNQESPIYKDSVYVNSGAPSIKSIKIDSTIFIKKPRKFIITAKDTNDGIVKKVFADWNNDSIADDSVPSDDGTFTFDHLFPANQSGTKKIRFWAIDNDTIKSIIKDTVVTIHLGAPHYFGRILGPDTSEYFANKPLSFHFRCIDTNGTIQKMIINWGDLTKVDTILQKISTPGFQVTIDTSHTFPNANDKNYITTIKLVDDDSILSTFTDTIHIKSGCPVVSIPGGGDTLFARVASSGGDTVLTVNGYDPNNSIVQYYWVLGGSLLDTSHSTSKTLIPSQKFYVAQNSVNTFMNGYSAVFAKDVDGNMGGDTFQIYFDGPPDSTTITFPSKDTNYVAKDTVILQWNGLDIHDSLITQFAIMVDWSDLTDRYDTLKGFSTAASYLNGNIFEYRFKPNTGGTHKIRIISKDRSGNEVWGKKREFGYPF